MVSGLMRIRKVDEIDAPDLAARLKSARGADDRSLAEICRQVGVSPQYWYNLERGTITTMSFETLRKIEEVLGVDFGVKL
jgi:transcriptional regulator with XRE-family HTH domain